MPEGHAAQSIPVPPEKPDNAQVVSTERYVEGQLCDFWLELGVLVTQFLMISSCWDFISPLATKCILG